MPTGYTSDLHDGKPQTFSEFVLSCARAFGALVLMRDAAADAEIPDEFPPANEHNEAQIAHYLARYKEVRAWSPEECADAHLAVWSEVSAQRAKAAVERREIKARYEWMLAKVRAWTPPTTEHEGLRTFMEEQLEESIRFDCADISYPALPPDDPETWRQKEMAEASRMHQAYLKYRDEEIERAAGRTAWVQALRASLPACKATP